jgi:hypothetical protein
MFLRIPPMTVLAMLPVLAACAEMTLPDLTIPMGDGVRMGADPKVPNQMLGVIVTDPFGRLSP